MSGLNTIPGLRQVAETLKAVRSVDRVPPQVRVVLNRCEVRLLGGMARQHHVSNLLGGEEVLSIREDNESAVHSVNTGIPMARKGGKISKDIGPIAKLVADAKTAAVSLRP